MRSHLLEGIVRHRRSRPFTYELEHSVFYLALDLDELDEVPRRVRLIGRNRRNVLAFRDADHLDPPAADLRTSIHARLRGAGVVEPAGWRITLVTNLRVLGYVFNPASFYLCRDPEGTLQVVIVEVHNTHGERHQYTLRPEHNGTTFVSSMEKAFYVSPFIDPVGSYTVRVRDEDKRLRITINEARDGELQLHASLDLARHRLSSRAVAGMLLRHPLMTHRTIGLIHVHALRIWRRGARFYRHGQATS
jgi:DUF1365 family protein